ncbi:MAG: YhbY family RNA-binding protein [Nanoarchaeota archaeon]|nr:YhbY family RNA-binding protein [Nanoarchaeota archaeon]
MDKKELAIQAKAIKPFTQIGAKGVTDGAIEKILLYLKKHKLGKIKLLDSALDSKDKKEVAQELVTRTKATLISQIGKTVVLWKR